MRILITGAGGYICQRLVRALEPEHELRLGDLQPLDDPRWVSLDVTRLNDCLAAAQNVDAVIHLAIASGQEGDFEDDVFNQKRFDVNVKGTWNALEAARRHGVKRVVHTSSIMVTWGYPPPAIIPGNAAPRPVGTYALTKSLAETIAAHFAANHGMSIVCLRIPKPIDSDDARRKARPIRPQWLAFSDLVQAYRLALTAPNINFEIVTVVGESSRRRWDLTQAEQVLGYRPTVRLEDLGFTLGDEREAF